jgi:hypothetical protein
MSPTTANVEEALFLAKPGATDSLEIGPRTPIYNKGKRREIEAIPNFPKTISLGLCHTVIVIRVIRGKVLGDLQ